MAQGTFAGRFGHRDTMERVGDPQSGRDVNQQIAAAREEASYSAQTEGERLIEASKSEMERFKAASAKRWGREAAPAETETHDKKMSTMDRFKAASRARNRR